MTVKHQCDTALKNATRTKEAEGQVFPVDMEALLLLYEAVSAVMHALQVNLFKED